VSPKLKRLSGAQVVGILRGFGFEVHSQRGSHIKLRRLGPSGEKETLTIPLHAELDAGTLRAIMRQAAHFIPEAELRPRFFSD